MLAQELHRCGSFWSLLLSIDGIWPNALGDRVARAAVACTAPITCVHHWAALSNCPTSIASGLASAASVMAAERG